MTMFASGDRASWLNTIAAKIIDGGDNPPSLDRLNIIVPPEIVTKENDGHVTAAAALGEKSRQDYRAGWRIIIQEMITLLREQGFVGGSDDRLTWIKSRDGTWKITMPGKDNVQITVFGQSERRMARDRAVVGERNEAGDRIGVPSLIESGRMHPFELNVIGPRGGHELMKFEIHPFALAIPPMTGAEREMLRISIERDGVSVPIVIYQKKILDGRNRAYFASTAMYNKPVEIKEFKGTEEEARREVIKLNLHRRHLNAVQLAVISEELYGARADKIVAEALAKGHSYGQKGKPNSCLVSGTSSTPEPGLRRDQVVADLAKADGIKTTRYAVGGIQEVMKDAPETLAIVKGGKFHKIRDVVTAALKEKKKPVPTLLPEITPRTVNERLGICIDNLNKILIDCEMATGPVMPIKISERIREIERLNNEVEKALRERKIIP